VSRSAELIIAGKRPKPRPVDAEAELRTAFSKFDRNGDGAIDVAELREAFSAAGREVVKEEVEAIMKSADVNFDGTIDFEEFKALMATQVPDVETSSRISVGSKNSVSSKTSQRTVESLQRASASVSEGISAFKGLAKSFMATSSPKNSRRATTGDVATIPETSTVSQTNMEVGTTSPQSRSSSKSSMFSSFGRRRSAS
jgi:hypothetical protein